MVILKIKELLNAGVLKCRDYCTAKMLRMGAYDFSSWTVEWFVNMNNVHECSMFMNCSSWNEDHEHVHELFMNSLYMHVHEHQVMNFISQLHVAGTWLCRQLPLRPNHWVKLSHTCSALSAAWVCWASCSNNRAVISGCSSELAAPLSSDSSSCFRGTWSTGDTCQSVRLLYIVHPNLVLTIHVTACM